MENEIVKRSHGRPKVFTAEELKKHKTSCMLNKEWYCDICKTGLNYTLAGKWSHLKTKKHNKNVHIKNIMSKIIEITQKNNPNNTQK